MYQKSRFKYFLIPGEHLPQEAKRLAPLLERAFAEFRERKISSMALVFLLIVIVCDERRPKDWWMKGKSEFNFADKGAEDIGWFFSGANFPNSITTVKDFFTTYRFKKIPNGIAHLLWNWSVNNLPLEVVQNVITPIEMLELQSQGKRIITISENSFLQGKLVDGYRDAFEFMLHDIAHADLFFSATYFEQINFFKNLRNILEVNQWYEKSKSDPSFLSALEYVMSDMNSGKEHLQSSLRAVVLEWKKRIEGSPISNIAEAQLRQEWGNIW